MAYIYKIENKLNHKVYIGKTVATIEERWKRHILDSKKSEECHRPLYAAFNKYGIENFVISQLEECKVEEASDREKYWIEFYRSFKYGYNATYGGDGTQYKDYNLIKNTYLKLQSLTDTAKACKVDIKTVKHALTNYNIVPKTFQQTNKRKYGKQVLGINNNTNQAISFTSLKDAARYIIDNNLSKSNIKSVSVTISRSVKREGTAYGFKWIFIN